MAVIGNNVVRPDLAQSGNKEPVNRGNIWPAVTEMTAIMQVWFWYLGYAGKGIDFLLVDSHPHTVCVVAMALTLADELTDCNFSPQLFTLCVCVRFRLLCMINLTRKPQSD